MGYLEYSQDEDKSYWNERDKRVVSGLTTQGYSVTVWTMKKQHSDCNDSFCSESSPYLLFLKTHSSLHEYLFCKTHVNAYLEGHGVAGRVS